MAVQLRAGNKYRNGRGKIVGPLIQDHGGINGFCFVDEDNRTYRIDGTWSMNDVAHPLDLVEEVIPYMRNG